MIVTFVGFCSTGVFSPEYSNEHCQNQLKGMFHFNTPLGCFAGQRSGPYILFLTDSCLLLSEPGVNG